MLNTSVWCNQVTRGIWGAQSPFESDTLDYITKCFRFKLNFLDFNTIYNKSIIYDYRRM